MSTRHGARKKQRPTTKIAAAALETMLVAEDLTSEDEREEVRRRRFHLILDEAVRRAEASCDESGARSASCVTAWEEVSEVRDAASRAGVRVAGEGEASRASREGAATSPAEELEKKARAREIRERLNKDPLMGSLPCERTGECTVPEGTLEARGRLMRAFESEGESETRPATDAKTVEEAVTRAHAAQDAETSRDDGRARVRQDARAEDRARWV